MKVLLTGATGFIGRHALAALQQAGVDMLAIGRKRPNVDVSFLEVDLLATPDLSAVIRQAQATHLLHLAWYAEHGKYWTSSLNLRWVEASVRLVEAFCVSGGRHVVLAGTCAEYDWAYGYCREDSTPLESATLYGTAKDATRRLCMSVCAQHQIPCAWGRIFLPFGPGEASARLIPALIAALRGQTPAFGINAMAYRDFLHASDVAAAFLCLLTKGASGAFNICSGEPVRLSQVVTTLAEILGADPTPILNLPSERIGEPVLLVGDNRKLKHLGWHTMLTLREGLEQTLRCPT
jgi:nucleoside-diphosphate-sugar epimerase